MIIHFFLKNRLTRLLEVSFLLLLRGASIHPECDLGPLPELVQGNLQLLE